MTYSDSHRSTRSAGIPPASGSSIFLHRKLLSTGTAGDPTVVAGLHPFPGDGSRIHRLLLLLPFPQFVDFIADQTIPDPSVEEIRALGNTVELADAAAVGDRRSLLRDAARTDRILLTFDLEYYELVFDDDAPRPPGVVCFRVEWETPRDPANLLAAVLTDDDLKVDGQFSVLETERMRQRPMDRPPE